MKVVIFNQFFTSWINKCELILFIYQSQSVIILLLNLFCHLNSQWICYCVSLISWAINDKKVSPIYSHKKRFIFSSNILFYCPIEMTKFDLMTKSRVERNSSPLLFYLFPFLYHSDYERQILSRMSSINGFILHMHIQSSVIIYTLMLLLNYF